MVLERPPEAPVSAPPPEVQTLGPIVPVRPLRLRWSGFVNRLIRQAAERGVGAAVADYLGHAGVSIVAHAPEETMAALESGGALMYGGHKAAVEPAGLLGWLARRCGREDVNFLGKPYSTQARLYDAVNNARTLEEQKTFKGAVFPLVPSGLATAEGAKNLNWRERRLRRRLLREGTLPQLRDIARANQQSLQSAADRTAQGELSVIFPTGRDSSATADKWFPGLAHMVLDVFKSKPETPLVGFQFGAALNFRRMLGTALRMLFRLKPKPLQLPLHLAKPLIVEDAVRQAWARLHEGAPWNREQVAAAIERPGQRAKMAKMVTEILRQHFIDSLGEAEKK